MTMEVYKAFKYRIYPTPEQENLIQRTFGCCRFVYNYFLEAEINNHKAGGKYFTKFDNMKSLTALKRELTWLNNVPLPALRSALEDLDFAFKTFFKAKGKVGFPRFHSKHDHDKSFRIDNSDRRSVRVEGNTLHVTKIGDIPAVFHRPVGGPIVKATIRQAPSGKYFASLVCKVEINPLPVCDTAIGIDVGLKDYATIFYHTTDVRSESYACGDNVRPFGATVDETGINSNSTETIPNPKHLSKYLKKLRHEQRRLSRKKKDSNNWNKQRIKVARAYERITNCRKDFQHKLSRRLVDTAQIICTENLNIKGMAQNRHLARAIADASWYEFIRQLEYKATWAGRVVQKVDTFFPSSQTCHICGYRNPITKDLAVRNWVCPQCGTAHNRDENASKVILKEGLRLLGAE